MPEANKDAPKKGKDADKEAEKKNAADAEAKKKAAKPKKPLTPWQSEFVCARVCVERGVQWLPAWCAARHRAVVVVDGASARAAARWQRSADGAALVRKPFCCRLPLT